MDEIERIEQRKIMVFTVAASVAFVLVLLWRRDAQLSVFAAVVIALLAAGAHGARSMTREPNWSVLQQEARLRGSELSRLRVWLGNMLPGLALGAVLLWWSSAA